MKINIVVLKKIRMFFEKGTGKMKTNGLLKK